MTRNKRKHLGLVNEHAKEIVQRAAKEDLKLKVQWENSKVDESVWKPPDSPFIGGARAARKAARMKQNNDAQHHTKSWRKKSVKDDFDEKVRLIPKSIKPLVDRYFACLLMSNIKEIMAFHSSPVNIRKILVAEACNRAGCLIPVKLPSTFKNANEYYNSLTGQILLESISILSSEMNRMKRKIEREEMDQLCADELPDTLSLDLLDHEVIEQGNHQNRHIRLVLKFQMQQLPENTEHFEYLRPGTCFQLMPSFVKREIDELFPVIASIRPALDRVLDMIELTIYDLKVIKYLVDFIDIGEWVALPLVSLINECRQFEVCQKQPNVLFMDKIIGMKKAKHIRFAQDSDEEQGEEYNLDQCNDSLLNKCEGTKFYSLQPFKILIPSGPCLPQLNYSQCKLICDFLDPTKSSPLSLVQGPPGTGKTTFLVSLLFHYLIRNAERGNVKKRLMVCAPSNKAVVVVASRFMMILSNLDFTCNAVLIGVENKLLSGIAENHHDSLKSGRIDNILAYSWLNTIINELLECCNYLNENNYNVDLLRTRLRAVYKMLKSQVPSSLRGTTILDALKRVLTDYSIKRNECIAELLAIKELLANLDESAVIRELLATADIIFCTLSTAGSSFVKNTSKIDDLFIDEAAQATEAELIIPFTLRPNRMMVIGDPKQLPATVTSTDAIKNGFNRSLHERLMIDVGCDYSLLDTQYRMRPQIANFPSTVFYSSRIQDGPNVCKPSYKSTLKHRNGAPFVFVNVAGKEKKDKASCSYYNEAEANEVALILNEMYLKLPKHLHGQLQIPDKVRVITFYQGQTKFIQRILRRKNLSNVLVSTVDSSQGCESDVVIVSFVRANISGRKGFIVDEKRLNVALTRARYQLICVGHALTLRHNDGKNCDDCVLNRLIYHAKKNQCLLESEHFK